MGCFLTKDSTGENVASMQKLASLKERLLPNSRAITVELRSCRDLKRIPAVLFRYLIRLVSPLTFFYFTVNLFGTFHKTSITRFCRANGPYMMFYVKPDQKIAGVQRYRSSHRYFNCWLFIFPTHGNSNETLSMLKYLPFYSTHHFYVFFISLFLYLLIYGLISSHQDHVMVIPIGIPRRNFNSW